MSKFQLPTQADIVAKNKELGFEIPTEYAEFLLVFNGGRPDKDRFVEQENGEEVVKFTVDCFFGIDIKKQDRFYDLYNQYIHLKHEMPRGYLPIAYDGVGNILTLGINEGNKGGIYRISATDDPGYETYKKYSPKLLS